MAISNLKDRMLEPLTQLLEPPSGLDVDFSQPPGAEALIAANSISWQIFANPVTLFIGGVAAVLLELAEPSVRAGVWDHSSFRRDPLMRLRRTGTAAMITVYAPRADAEKMIARVVQMHDRVRGELADGTLYHANDARLLNWVQATASFGFIEAYHRYAKRLDEAQRDAAFAEGAVAARLYGAVGAPTSLAGWEAMLAETLPGLEPSAVLDEFLDIMRNTPLFPGPLRKLQPVLVDAAITILPGEVLTSLGLADNVLGTAGEASVKSLAKTANHIRLPHTPYARSMQRMEGRG